MTAVPKPSDLDEGLKEALVDVLEILVTQRTPSLGPYHLGARNDLTRSPACSLFNVQIGIVRYQAGGSEADPGANIGGAAAGVFAFGRIDDR